MSAAGMQAAFSMLGKTSCWGPGGAGKARRRRKSFCTRSTKMTQEAKEGQPWVQLMGRDRQIAVDMGTGSYSRAEVEP